MEQLREIFKTRQSNTAWETNFSLKNYTDFSIWTQSIRQLCQNAVSNIITHLSITDKASLLAYTQWRAMNIWEWYGLKMIPWIESSVKIWDETRFHINMLLYFSDKLLRDPNFIKNINEAIVLWNQNGWTDLTDILYLRNRYDIASIISNPFEENMTESEIKAFIETMVSKWEMDGFYSNMKHNNQIPNWYEVPIFIWSEENNANNDISFTSNIENRDFEYLSRKWDLWVMIWRLNPPHIGHIRVIKKAIRENAKLLLFLWSANKLDEKNPFSANERLFFLNFYFKDEIKSGKLTIGTLNDVWDYQKWVTNLWIEISSIFPDFKWKINIYWWNMKADMAINAISQYQDNLWLENINYREIEREDFFINHNWEKIEISATSVRNALNTWNDELAKKLMNNELSDLVINKWKEKNEQLISKKLFFIFTPEYDKDGNIHRNFKKSEIIKKQVNSDFDQNNIVDDINESDIIVVVWWDGSLLWAIKQYAHLWKAFYPVAAWTKNFIPSNFIHPYQILTEESEILEFPLLDVQFFDDKSKILSQEIALNDVYLNVESGTMWILMIEWNDYPSRIIEWDWIIVSTPIWSTAYTKKAGGNVLPLNNDVLSITDIASSNNISHIVDWNQEITIDVIRWDFIAHADSYEQKWVYKVKIWKSDKTVKIIFPVWEEFRLNRYKEK